MGNVYKLGVQDDAELGDAVDDKIDANGELRLTRGTNKQTGTAVLVAGTVTVANTLVKTASLVRHWRQVTGGTVGHLTVGAIVDGTSFVLTSSSNTDTSTIGWEILNAVDSDTDPSDYEETD
jgi:hypothetical protein